MSVPWDLLLGDADRRLRGSDIRDLLAVTARPDIISFAGGLPAPELFPLDDLRAAFDAALRGGGGSAVQYGPTEGYAPLRAYLAARLARRGIVATPDDILITTGSQQGLDLLGKVLLSPRATVLVEEPSYVGALQAFAAYGPRVAGVPMDDAGLQVDHVDAPLTTRGRDPLGHDNPAVLYTIPTFQNPSGLTMSLRRRAALIELCAARRLPVIEDDPYGELRYEGEDTPPLRALPGGEETVYLGTFSKILAPGLRLGWVVAPRPLMARLVRAKQGADLHTDTLAQRAVLQYCLHADLDGHIARLRRAYRERRDAMLAALARYLPPEARWTRRRVRPRRGVPRGARRRTGRAGRAVPAAELLARGPGAHRRRHTASGRSRGRDPTTPGAGVRSSYRARAGREAHGAAVWEDTMALCLRCEGWQAGTNRGMR